MVNWSHMHDQQAAQIDNFLEFLWVTMPTSSKQDTHYKVVKKTEVVCSRYLDRILERISPNS